VGPGAGTDRVVKGKNTSPCRDSNFGHPALILVTVLTELPRLWRTNPDNVLVYLEDNK